MSVVSSIKTNYSSFSEMSLASSALMTAESTNTLSDCDYETSSELPSPRTLNEYNFQFSRTPSSLHSPTSFNSVLNSSQSSSVLQEKDNDSLILDKAAQYVLSIKSDTCLSQQSKIISEFMSDALSAIELQDQPEEIISIALPEYDELPGENELLKENELPEEDELPEENELTENELSKEIELPEDNELPKDNELLEGNEVPGGNELPDLEHFLPADFIASLDSTDLFTKNEAEGEDNATGSLLSVNPSVTTVTPKSVNEQLEPTVDEDEATNPEEEPMISMSEAKHKIMENLAQVTFSKFCFKADSPRLTPEEASPPNTRSAFTTKRSEESLSRIKPQKSSISRRSVSRSSLGVESILKIDHELQPLNLMLSKLVAEFRAMNLKGKLTTLSPSVCNFSDYQNSWKLFPSEIESFNKRPSSKRFVGKEDKIERGTAGKETPRWRSQEMRPSMKDKSTSTENSSFEELSKEFKKPISLSNEQLNNLQGASRMKADTLTTRSCDSNSQFLRESKTEEEQSRAKASEKADSHQRCCRRHRKKWSHHESVLSPRPQRDSGDDDNEDDFGAKILEEIRSLSERCADERQNERREGPENSEQPEKDGDEEENGSFFRRGFISLAENYAFFRPARPEMAMPDNGGGGDSLLNDKADKIEISLMPEEVSDYQQGVILLEVKMEESLLMTDNQK